MAHPNPVQLEAFFSETMRQITTASSERIQLQLIAGFLDEISGFEKETESYLIQLFEKLPDFSSPLLYAGLNPDLFKELITQLEHTIQLLDLGEEEKLITKKVTGFKKPVAQLYRWVGEQDEGGILEDALVLLEGRKSLTEFPGGVLVPVIEQSQTIQSGRLRRLKVDIIGVSKNGFQLKPTFGVIGADAGSFLEEVEEVSGNLLRESRNGKNKVWKATALFELSHAWHAGRSANLALAGAFYCEMLKAEEQSEYFRLNPAVCIKGDIDKTGRVISVDEHSLQLKVEAAFFAWIHVLVVPVDQLTKALLYVEKLQAQFPNRYLPVVGVSHLRELFFDRRITLHNKTGAIAHNLKRAWKRRFSVASFFVFVMLIGIIGRLVYGPVDRNPVAIDFAGTSMFVKNKSGVILKTINVEPGFVEHHLLRSDLNKYALLDIDEDGINELIYNGYKYGGIENDSIFCYSFAEERFLWKTEVDFQLDYSFRPDLVELRWGIGEINTGKISNESEIFFTAAVSTFFPNILAKINKLTGKIEEFYINPGHIADFRIEDFNKDGTNEILLLADNNSFWGSSVYILDGQNFEGHAPSLASYKALNVPFSKIIGMVFFPKTIIGKLKKESKGTYGRTLRFVEKKGLVTAHIFESREVRNSSSEIENPIMLYTLDKNLNVVGIGSGDGWDIWARKYFEEGILDFEPSIEYLEAFKDSLLWWDGEQFVNKPTLANGYPLPSDN